jgi:hypothetical protein
MPTIVPKGLHWVNIPPAQKAGFSHSQIRVRATHERPSRSLSQARPSLARQRAEGGIPDSQPWVGSQLAQVQNSPDMADTPREQTKPFRGPTTPARAVSRSIYFRSLVPNPPCWVFLGYWEPPFLFEASAEKSAR